VSGPGASATTDRETAAGRDDRLELRLWLRLLTCSTLIERRMRAMLREQFETTLPRFDMLAQLERSPEGLTMGELSARLMVSNGNITGLVDRLVEEGAIRRTPSPTDRRSSRVNLTPEGRKLFATMSSAHARWIDDLLAGVGREDKARLYDLLGKLKSSAKAPPTAPSA
jgi:DNA-binding MarR family transcriptional regulator